MYTFEIATYKKAACISVTKEVREAVLKSGVKSGIAVVYTPHTTTGIMINENADPDVSRDLMAALESIVPSLPYRHGEGNSPAHLRSVITGCNTCIPIENSQLCLGTWQGVFFCEFDGPRQRKFFVQVLSC